MRSREDHARGPGMAQFELDRCGLKITGELRERDYKELEEWCRRLSETEAQVVQVDVSAVQRIHSSCLATLVSLQLALREAGRRLRLIPSPAVEKVLKLGGFGPLLMPESEP